MRIRIGKQERVTLPKRLRERIGMREHSAVSIIPIGCSILISKRPLLAEQLQRLAHLELTEQGITLETMLANQDTIRSEYNATHYGIQNS